LFIYKGNYLKAIRTCEVGGVPSVPIQGGEGKGTGTEGEKEGEGEGEGNPAIVYLASQRARIAPKTGKSCPDQGSAEEQIA